MERNSSSILKRKVRKFNLNITEAWENKSEFYMLCVSPIFLHTGQKRKLHLYIQNALCSRVASVLFSIVITSLGDKESGLCTSRAFIYLFIYLLLLLLLLILHCLISTFFLFLLMSGVGCGL